MGADQSAMQEAMSAMGGMGIGGGPQMDEEMAERMQDDRAPPMPHLVCPQPPGPLRDALHGDVAAVRAHLDAGADVNALFAWHGPLSWRQPLLTAASSSGAAGVVALLLARGADPDLYDAGDIFAGYEAAQFGHARVAELLLEGGADVDRVTGPGHNHGNGETALYMASAAGELGVVEVYLRFGARVDLANMVGGTPFYLAAQTGRVPVLRRLKAAGADVNQGRTDAGGEGNSSPLFIAATTGRTRVVQALIDLGADVDRPNNRGMTPLMAAAFYGKKDAAIALLRAGCDATATMESERPKLMINVANLPEEGTNDAVRLARNRNFISIADLIKKAIRRRPLVGARVVVHSTAAADVNGAAGVAAPLALPLALRAALLRRAPAEHRCARCQAAAYCGRAHQREHWKAGHKAACAPSGRRRATRAPRSAPTTAGDVALPRPATRVAFAPPGAGGLRVAVVNGDPMSTFAVAVLELDGGGVRARRPAASGETTEFAWAPDGARLACHGKGNVHVVAVDRPHERVTRFARPEVDEAFMARTFCCGEVRGARRRLGEGPRRRRGPRPRRLRGHDRARLDRGDRRAGLGPPRPRRGGPRRPRGTPDGSAALSGSADGTIRALRARDGVALSVYDCGGPVNTLAAAPGGGAFAFASRPRRSRAAGAVDERQSFYASLGRKRWQQTVQLWRLLDGDGADGDEDAETADCTAREYGGSSEGALAFSPCGAFLAAAVGGSHPYLIDESRARPADHLRLVAETGSLLQTLPTSTGATNALAWSPCGSALAAAATVYPDDAETMKNHKFAGARIFRCDEVAVAMKRAVVRILERGLDASAAPTRGARSRADRERTMDRPMGAIKASRADAGSEKWGRSDARRRGAARIQSTASGDRRVPRRP
ncbi:hypothetical protein SO694_00004050 [Aureococcus anophagefferens]|uniref:MYND-type domain-containing protein n=1 Tax=Aureococcus anophagefferens TaxID=44056 RepID=A0ABR1G9B6_AURAN